MMVIDEQLYGSPNEKLLEDCDQTRADILLWFANVQPEMGTMQELSFDEIVLLYLFERVQKAEECVERENSKESSLLSYNDKAEDYSEYCIPCRIGKLQKTLTQYAARFRERGYTVIECDGYIEIISSCGDIRIKFIEVETYDS